MLEILNLFAQINMQRWHDAFLILSKCIEPNLQLFIKKEYDYMQIVMGWDCVGKPTISASVGLCVRRLRNRRVNYTSIHVQTCEVLFHSHWY